MKLRNTILAAVALTLAALPASADQRSAVAAVKQMNRVIDAVPDNAGNLWVTVAPDAKVEWSKFAAVACQVVRPHQARIFLVKMVDATSVPGRKKPTDWRLLGGANCSQ